MKALHDLKIGDKILGKNTNYYFVGITNVYKAHSFSTYANYFYDFDLYLVPESKIEIDWVNSLTTIHYIDIGYRVQPATKEERERILGIIAKIQLVHEINIIPLDVQEFLKIHKEDLITYCKEIGLYDLQRGDVISNYYVFLGINEVYDIVLYNITFQYQTVYDKACDLKEKVEHRPGYMEQFYTGKTVKEAIRGI